MSTPDFEKMDKAELLQWIDKVDWYHTIDLGSGIATDGFFDLRPYLAQYGFPENLSGKRVLDLGRASGFFSFEFERRGADVTATELPNSLDKEFVGGDFTREVWRRWILENQQKGRIDEDSIGRRLDFFLAHAILRSKVKPITLKLSELSLEAVGGKPFDLVFVGSLLNHTLNPVGSLARIFDVTADICIVANPTSGDTSKTPRMDLVGRSANSLTTWFVPNVTCLVELMHCVGFEDVQVVCEEVMLPTKLGSKIRHAIVHGKKPKDREASIDQWAKLTRGATPPVFANFKTNDRRV